MLHQYQENILTLLKKHFKKNHLIQRHFLSHGRADLTISASL
jgi:hypothetical protein